jgi:mRNA interferase MazF
MNNFIGTIIVAPMTTKSKIYPTRVKTIFNKKAGFIVLDQIRTIDKSRFVQKLGKINMDAVTSVKAGLREMLVE